jgi:hypothetical protein
MMLVVAVLGTAGSVYLLRETQPPKSTAYAYQGSEICQQCSKSHGAYVCSGCISADQVGDGTGIDMNQYPIPATDVSYPSDIELLRAG